MRHVPNRAPRLLDERLGSERNLAKAANQRHGTPILHNARAGRPNAPVWAQSGLRPRHREARIGRERGQRKLDVGREEDPGT